ncbi:hypothetical protein DPV78_007117 [Talaromyces pinophilus]|nr:hypothetical protein DPV78_007117 [Talaromyces pinophilus]
MSSAGARIWSIQAVDKVANSRDEAAIDLIEAIVPNSVEKVRFPESECQFTESDYGFMARWIELFI